jgi:hypothetical protein
MVDNETKEEAAPSAVEDAMVMSEVELVDRLITLQLQQKKWQLSHQSNWESYNVLMAPLQETLGLVSSKEGKRLLDKVPEEEVETAMKDLAVDEADEDETAIYVEIINEQIRCLEQSRDETLADIEASLEGNRPEIDQLLNKLKATNNYSNMTSVQIQDKILRNEFYQQAADDLESIFPVTQNKAYWKTKLEDEELRNTRG